MLDLLPIDIPRRAIAGPGPFCFKHLAECNGAQGALVLSA